MNEVGFLGAFIPDFGRIVALMQFNMYHWFTVDEHTIQCLKVLSEIEKLPKNYGTAVEGIFSSKSLNRKVYSEGAFIAARWLLGKGPGLYEISDIYLSKTP